MVEEEINLANKEAQYYMSVILCQGQGIPVFTFHLLLAARPLSKCLSSLYPRAQTRPHEPRLEKSHSAKV